VVRIREATERDSDAIAALWTEVYCGPAPGMRRAPYEVADVEESRAAGRLLVAEEDGAQAGVVVLRLPGPGSGEIARPEEAELSRLAVARRFRRLGIGWALTSRCIDTALEAGAAGIVLWSRPHQTAAHALYDALDFLRDPCRDSADELGPRQVFHISLATDV
jgi:ribosomal protein S18 acetylase RimI-like enzyme